MIKKVLLSVCISFFLFISVSITSPVIAITDSHNLNIPAQQSISLATLQYEAKEPSTLNAPITDPNFNTMRNKEMGKSFAVPLVVSILFLAVVAPLATWWYFSK